MLPRKILENLHAANGCFSAFRIIFRQVLFKFLTLKIIILSELVQRIDGFLVIGG